MLGEPPPVPDGFIADTIDDRRLPDVEVIFRLTKRSTDRYNVSFTAKQLGLEYLRLVRVHGDSDGISGVWVFTPENLCIFYCNYWSTAGNLISEDQLRNSTNINLVPIELVGVYYTLFDNNSVHNYLVG